MGKQKDLFSNPNVVNENKIVDIPNPTLRAIGNLPRYKKFGLKLTSPIKKKD
tara:strand:+ start:326 stop:481 length:156 start_codon:yes stop_codon:yes gene_type:complete